MALPTDTEIRTRIGAICDEISGITTILTREEADITTAMLPAVQVWTRAMAGVPTSATLATTTRGFDIVLYVTRLAKEENALWEQIDALNAAEAWLHVIPDYFRTHAPRLELAKVPLTGILVNRNQTISDDGVELRQWHRGAFSAITHHLNVSMQRS